MDTGKVAALLQKLPAEFTQNKYLRLFAWPLFMLGVLLSMLVLNWTSLSVPLVLFMLLLVAGTGWLARDWRMMQLAIVIVVTLFYVCSLAGFDHGIVRFLIIFMPVVLLLCLLLGVLASHQLVPVKLEHVSLVSWLVITGYCLLLLLLAGLKPDSGLVYTRLALGSLEEGLLLMLVCMMYLLLQFQRHYPRFPLEYVLFIPACLTGLLASGLLYNIDLDSLKVPDGILESALLLVHVPLLILALAVLFNLAGFALLRLLSDTAWIRQKQNRDVIETQQSGLDDYLYQQGQLAIMLLGTGMLVGLYWSDQAWGHYWQWDAKYFLTLAVWCFYLAAVHLRLRGSRQVRAFAWWIISGLPLLVLLLYGTHNWSHGLHNFTGL